MSVVSNKVGGDADGGDGGDCGDGDDGGNGGDGGDGSCGRPSALDTTYQVVNMSLALSLVRFLALATWYYLCIKGGKIMYDLTLCVWIRVCLCVSVCACVCVFGGGSTAPYSLCVCACVRVCVCACDGLVRRCCVLYWFRAATQSRQCSHLMNTPRA